MFKTLARLKGVVMQKQLSSQCGTRTRETFFHALLLSYYCLLHHLVIPPPGTGFRQALRKQEIILLRGGGRSPTGCHQGGTGCRATHPKCSFYQVIPQRSPPQVNMAFSHITLTHKKRNMTKVSYFCTASWKPGRGAGYPWFVSDSSYLVLRTGLECCS